MLWLGFESRSCSTLWVVWTNWASENFEKVLQCFRTNKWMFCNVELIQSANHYTFRGKNIVLLPCGEWSLEEIVCSTNWFGLEHGRLRVFQDVPWEDPAVCLLLCCTRNLPAAYTSMHSVCNHTHNRKHRVDYSELCGLHAFVAFLYIVYWLVCQPCLQALVMNVELHNRYSVTPLLLLTLFYNTANTQDTYGNKDEC